MKTNFAEKITIISVTVGDDVYKCIVMKRNWVFTNLSHKVLYIK